MTISQIIPGALDTADLSETVASTALGRAEHPANKDAANGYAGLDAGTKLSLAQIPTGVELSANKGVASGYAGLDADALVPQAQRAPDLTRARRMVTCKAFGTTFDVHGLATPTLRTVGAAAASLDDTDGVYVSLTNEGSVSLGHADSVSGLDISTSTKRRLSPDIVFTFRTAMADSRLWVGLFSGDPSQFTQLAGTDPISGSVSIKGVGFHYDYKTFQPQITNETTFSCAAATKTYHSSSYDFLLLGFRAGQSVTWSGFGNGADGVKTIVSVTSTDMVVSEATADASAGASVSCALTGGAVAELRAMASTGSAQTTLLTGITVAAMTNTKHALRVRWTASGWEFSDYNFTAKAWQYITTIALSAGPALNDNLGIYCTLTHCNYLTTTDRAISIESIVLDAE